MVMPLILTRHYSENTGSGIHGDIFPNDMNSGVKPYEFIFFRR